MKTFGNKKKEDYKFLESLVGQRYNEESLLVQLNNHFGSVSILSIDEEPGETDESDWKYYIETPEFDYCIFYLKMKNTGWDGSTFYITETI